MKELLSVYYIWSSERVNTGVIVDTAQNIKQQQVIVFKNSVFPIKNLN